MACGNAPPTVPGVVDAQETRVSPLLLGMVAKGRRGAEGWGTVGVSVCLSPGNSDTIRHPANLAHL